MNKKRAQGGNHRQPSVGGRKAKKSKQLTPRESSFLEHYVAGTTISKAARLAGYSSKWPGQAGSQALRNIQKKRPKILYELGLSFEAIIEQLKDAENI